MITLEDIYGEIKELDSTDTCSISEAVCKFSEDFNNFDINKDIEKSTDVEYLKELERYVDMDIDNIGKDSDVIKKMKAKMRNLSVEEMEKQQKEGFLNLKNKIQKRISELGG
jgi:hypothetical protein